MPRLGRKNVNSHSNKSYAVVKNNASTKRMKPPGTPQRADENDSNNISGGKSDNTKSED